MNELISFETFCEGWRYARMSNPYYSFGCTGTVNPGSDAAAAIISYVRERESTATSLWDSGDFVYGLS